VGGSETCKEEVNTIPVDETVLDGEVVRVVVECCTDDTGLVSVLD